MAELSRALIKISFVSTVTLIFLWGATQWTAAHFAYHPALGSPWLLTFGYPVYAPWKLFSWWVAHDAAAPAIFLQAGLTVALGGLASGAIVCGASLWRGVSRSKPATYGSARWAHGRDLSTAGLFGDRGVVLGSSQGRYLRHDGPEHVLAAAPTRSGKGVGLVVPTLLSWPQAAIIHDIKGENWTLTAGWRAQFSRCLRFDPTVEETARFNPLFEVRRGTHEVRDAQSIADILVDPDGARPSRDHWEKTAHALLTGAILHVLYAEKDKSLAGVARFLADPERSMAETLQVMMITNHIGTEDTPCAHPVIASIARELLNKAENERSGVISTAMSFLSLYRDPVIAAATASSDWRIAELRQSVRPVSLYLVVPPSDISRTRPLIRLILNQIVRRLTEQLEWSGREADHRQLLLMLDEFPALGRLPFFEGALAFLAGYGIRVFLIAQSLNQIDQAYGANNAILDNAHIRIAFAPNDERTARRLSEMLGTTTEERSLTNLSGKRLSVWLSHKAVARQETPRPLLTPGEVLQLPGNEALIFVSGLPPIRAQKLRAYEDRNFIARTLPAPDHASAPGQYRQTHDWDGPRRLADARLAARMQDCESTADSTTIGGTGLMPVRPQADLGLLADDEGSATPPRKPRTGRVRTADNFDFGF